jgi:hypothetical protein
MIHVTQEVQETRTIALVLVVHLARLRTSIVTIASVAEHPCRPVSALDDSLVAEALVSSDDVDTGERSAAPIRSRRGAIQPRAL